MKYKISFIVPVYNAQKYLRECVDSIIVQDGFESIELVLVDDGSSDASAAICDMYSQRFENIITVHKKNGGVSSARNEGVSISTGEYIAFVDADDFLFKGIVQKILEAIKNNSPDLLFFNFKYETEKDYFTTDFPFEKNKILDESYIKTTLVDFMLKDTSYNCVWNKVFKKSIIEKNKILFSIGKKYGEDREFVLNFFTVCKSAYFLPECGYFYRFVKSGAIHKARTDYFKSISQEFKLTLEIYKKFNLEKEYVREKSADIYSQQFGDAIFKTYKNLKAADFKNEIKALQSNKDLIELLSAFDLFKDETVRKIAVLILKKKVFSARLFLSYLSFKGQVYNLVKGQTQEVNKKEACHPQLDNSQRLKWPVTTTVFTPIYNRKRTIHRVFDSLMLQTNKDFEWLIVDDGSSDNVKELIDEYQKKADFSIRYYYKPNGGKHTAHNYACYLTDSEYFLIVDSDDAIAPNAVELFEKYWNLIPENQRDFYWCVVGLCADVKTGEVIGDKFPQGINEVPNPRELAKGISGDKASSIKTKILKDFPFPEHKGTTFITESIVWNKIDQQYKQYYINDIMKICYLNEPDSLSTAWYKTHIKEGYVSNYYWMLSNLNDGALSAKEKLITIARAAYYGCVAEKGKREILGDINSSGDRALYRLISFIPPIIKKLRSDKYLKQED